MSRQPNQAGRRKAPGQPPRCILADRDAEKFMYCGGFELPVALSRFVLE